MPDCQRTIILAVLLTLLPLLSARAQRYEPTRCGTAVLAELTANGRFPDGKGRSLLGIPCERRSVKQNSILSEGDHFRIHYDITGSDAVNPLDRNDNSIPDFIDSVGFYMEFAWQQEIGKYGWAPPPPDNSGGGGEVDVYVCELNGQYYGVAFPESGNPTDFGVSGFLVLDNDYDEYRTSGIAGLRVTTAHEFNHILQFASYRFDLSQSSIYEATATWFERELHPEIPDYRQYSDSLLLRPQDYGFSTNATGTSVTGYAHVLYLDYLEKRLNPGVILEIWEEFRSGQTQWQAIDAALRRYDLNLTTSYCEFAKWVYYTGDRARDTMYFYEAADYPTMRAAQIRPWEGEDLSISNELYPLSFGLYQLTIGRDNPNLRDTVDILVTNARTDIGKGGLSIDKDDFTLQFATEERDGFRPLRGAGDSIFYRMSPPRNEWCTDVILGGRQVFLIATRISPQPFVIDGAERLLFDVPTNGQELRSVRVTLYSVAMRPMRTIQGNALQARNDQLGLLWDGRTDDGDLVASGVYIYEMVVNDGEPIIGKVAVLRK